LRYARRRKGTHFEIKVGRQQLTHVCFAPDSESLFAAWDSNSSSRRRDNRIIVWGTTPPCAELTGDSGNGFEAALIGDCRLFRLFAENWSFGVLGIVAKQFRPARQRLDTKGASCCTGSGEVAPTAGDFVAETDNKQASVGARARS